MIFAAVDIGSNAGRLLIAHVFEKRNQIYASKIALVRVPLRLGMDVFEKGYISDEKIDMLIKTFKAYELIKDIYKPIDFTACATAAIRESKNKEQVLEIIKKETGIKLKVLDGLEEAEIVSHANNIYVNKIHDDTLYIDVGGGSTEMSYFKKEKFISSQSFQIGTIKYLFDQVENSEWLRLKEWLETVRDTKQKVNCICSGGNISKLTDLFGNKDNTITRTQIKFAVGELEKHSYEERIERFTLRPDRADVIIPAAKIFNNIMKWGNIEYLIAPQLGLVDGLAIELYKKYKKENG
ncbi:MAG: Ppx/GppA family phosphatase [Bacteroidales bacterium]|jgi:exopolyphosphatase/guanosine-5'-triphosphate,3'-diphosphate pyrophosphatase|nr:Ppx/GppA family phosphatase [Bacteroidales bacterium]HOL98897.1 Ppx/GppA family phosphatase [Bacteroidales bacterium]HOM37203.1 Ppx/GppA family phosphatase [Bacteroidales bacterium]HRT80053.1 Ppx/GppA family phosphatase [Bacteroidales bacterium]HUM33322.1 Ppx/GppA family phosphatase [Bacteroidales bacterium]